MSDERSGWEKARDKAILASNVTGMASAIPATYQAVKGRGEGGIPRDLARKAPGNSRASRALRAGAKALDNPGTNKRLRIAAGVAGGTMIGLQAMNIAGDSLSAHKTVQEGRKRKVKTTDNGIAKCYEGPSRGDGEGVNLARAQVAKAIEYPTIVERRPANTAESAAPAALAGGSVVAGAMTGRKIAAINRHVGEARRGWGTGGPKRKKGDAVPEKPKRLYRNMYNPIGEMKREARLLLADPRKVPAAKIGYYGNNKMKNGLDTHLKLRGGAKKLAATSALLAGGAVLAEGNRRRDKARNQWT